MTWLRRWLRSPFAFRHRPDLAEIEPTRERPGRALDRIVGWGRDD